MEYRTLFAICTIVPTLAFGAPTCPSGIGTNEGQKPVRTIWLRAGPPLLVCGGVDLNDKKQKIYSEFELIDASTRTPVARFGATDRVTIRQLRSSLVLTEHRMYGVGKNWTLAPIPFRQHMVASKSGGEFTHSSKLIFVPPRLSNTQLEGIQKMYDRAKDNGYVRDGLPSLVVLAALSGSSKFESLLPTVVGDLKLDGALGEEFSSAMRDYAEIRHREWDENLMVLK